MQLVRVSLLNSLRKIRDICPLLTTVLSTHVVLRIVIRSPVFESINLLENFGLYNWMPVCVHKSMMVKTNIVLSKSLESETFL